MCSVYEFVITNTASVAQTIYVSLVPMQNTFDNLYFAAFKATAASADYKVALGSSGSGNNFTLVAQTIFGNSTLGHQATKLTKNSTIPINMPGLSTNLNAGSSVTYTILVWLQDVKTAQNQEQGGSFKAGINVTTANGGTGITGILHSANVIYTVDFNGISYGNEISDNVTKYYDPDGPTQAMAALREHGNGITDSPFFLKHEIQNFNGYLWYAVGSDDEYTWIDGTFLTQSDCEDALTTITNDSSGTYECSQLTGLWDIIGSENGDTWIDYTIPTEEACIAELQYYDSNDGITYTCSYRSGLINDEIVVGNYVGFVVTPEMVTANPEMTEGTYYLKGGDNGASYSDNVAILQSAFGTNNSYCGYAYNYYYCAVRDFRVFAVDNGEVTVNNYDNSNHGVYCEIYNNNAMCGTQ